MKNESVEEQNKSSGSELRSLIEKIDEKKRNELGGKKPVNVFTALNKSLDLIEELRSYLKVVEKNCIVFPKKDLEELIEKLKPDVHCSCGRLLVRGSNLEGMVECPKFREEYDKAKDIETEYRVIEDHVFYGSEEDLREYEVLKRLRDGRLLGQKKKEVGE